MSTQQSIDEMSDEEYIAYLISIGRLEVVTDHDGTVRYVETGLLPTREELQQILDKLVAEGKIRKCTDHDGKVRYYAVRFVQ